MIFGHKRKEEFFMAGSVNKVIIIGNLGRDPEIRQLQDGSKVAQLSVATSESWKDKMTGERRDRTEWHRVVIFNDRLVDVAERFLKKGAKVYIEGQLQTRKWTDPATNADKYTTEVVLSRFRGELTMLEGKGGDSMDEVSGFSDTQLSQSSVGSSSKMSSDFDDEIPF